MPGLGTIGQDSARKFALPGFPSMGRSRTPTAVQGVETFHVPDGLDRLLARANILVNVLPLAHDTKGLLNAGASAKLPKGACLINMARGGHMVDEALLVALDSGHLAGAGLDVFNIEPLPPDHRYWVHTGMQVTPHIAGATKPLTASSGAIETIKRLRQARN